MTSLNVMIVDDEAHCRLNLRESVAQHTSWNIVGEYKDAINLLKNIAELTQTTSVDLVFLDISMPQLSGIEAAMQIVNLSKPPMIVFVTAFDDYAIDAFEICACDYLLKPFDTERFKKCAKRVNELFAQQSRYQQGLDVLSGKEYLSRIVIKSMTSVRAIPTKNVHYLASAGNYVEIYHDDGCDLLRSSLSQLFSYLDPDEFCQIHRQIVVKFTQAKELVTTPEGKHQLILLSGKSVPVGDTFRADFLQQWLASPVQ
ncbi:LytR/AlgR family response regulator transcription factor [Ningiella sp. W23]|uniref:LytR/AlgR family response regulator transcription factor n=1 Tax=Ningiella sp. W23 TaxID=3023715 RepID=UPI0037572DED